jgi:hypothetical protein
MIKQTGVLALNKMQHEYTGKSRSGQTRVKEDAIAHPKGNDQQMDKEEAHVH